MRGSAPQHTLQQASQHIELRGKYLLPDTDPASGHKSWGVYMSSRATVTAAALRHSVPCFGCVAPAWQGAAVRGVHPTLACPDGAWVVVAGTW